MLNPSVATADPHAGLLASNSHHTFLAGQYVRVSAFLHDAGELKWAQRNVVGALVCLPVLTLWIFLGILSGQHKLAGYAIAGAVSLGFGGFQNLGPRRSAPMIALLSGLAIATWVGCITVGRAWPTHVIVVTVFGYGFGAVTMLGYEGWWLGLQWMVALVVYGARPASSIDAIHISLAVLCGGASQFVFLLLTRPYTGPWFHRQTQPPFDFEGSRWRALRSAMNPRKLSGRYALRVALAMAASAIVAHFWPLPNNYWVSMTTAVLMKPNFYEASIRILNRVLGTIAGASITTTFLAVAKPGAPARGVILVAIVWSMYALQRVNYALFATCLTAYVVMLFATHGLPELPIAWHRVLSTLAGAAIALLVSLMPTPVKPIDHATPSPFSGLPGGAPA